MICRAVQPRPASPDWHQGFLAMLPAIATHARIAFGNLGPEARQEAVQEAVCNAMVAYVALAQRGKVALAYPSVLARFAVAQTRGHRKVGGHLNCKDISSKYCQAHKGVVVERLGRFDGEEGQWVEAVVEDHHTPVPEQVAFRCDFPAWLNTLSRRNRRIAQALAVGHNTGEIARRFKVSAGRISQLRRELHQSWNEFLDEVLPPNEPAKRRA
jgi:hypothetical protein